MRITQEADYAVRIINCLTQNSRRMDARSISEQTAVTMRFTLKILRKLVISKIVVSYKGVQGGYELNKDPKDINLCDVIEAVDGPISINRCLQGDTCTQNGDANVCYYHNVFADVSQMVRDKLTSITFEKAVSTHNSGCK